MRYGCRVPSLGVAFMLLTPMLYTDVSAASALQNRRQRLAIGAAGVIVELAIVAIATLAWSFLPDGPLRSVAFMLLRVTAVTGGTVGAAQSLTYGALTVHADGSWLFAPNAAANALKAGDIRTEVVTYTVTDGTHVKTATLSIEIRGVNDAPTLVDPVTGLAPTDPNAVIARQTVADGSSITIPTAQAFADTDGGDTRTYMLTGAPAWLAIDPVNGLITTIGSVPADASQSGPYPLTVTMRDGSNAEVATSFVLDVTNPAPVAVADTSRDGENATQTGGLLANDDVAAWRS